MSLLKRMLNVPEQITYRRLSEVCTRRNALLYAKVRLADVLPIEGSGISRELYDFALTSHYDFVVSDRDQQPIFAVEFDGPQHRLSQQAERDARKDEISRRFHLTLFRVDSNDLIRTESCLDRLTDLMERYFDRSEPDRNKLATGLAQSPDSLKIRSCAMNLKPSCPSCHGEMVVKNGKYGPFYSCIRYPECRGSCDLPRPSPHPPGHPAPVAAVENDPRHRERLLSGIATGFAVLVLIVAGISWLRLEKQTGAARPPVEDRVIDKNVSSDAATERQMNLLGLLIRRRGWSETERDSQVENVLGHRRVYSELSKKEASKLITAWDDRKK